MGRPCGNKHQRLNNPDDLTRLRDGRVFDPKRTNLIVGLSLIFFPPVTPNQCGRSDELK